MILPRALQLNWLTSLGVSNGGIECSNPPTPIVIIELSKKLWYLIVAEWLWECLSNLFPTSFSPSLSLSLVWPFVCLSYFRAAGNASEEALDRLPTSATCMNLLKLPPYRRFVPVLNSFLEMQRVFLGTI